MLLFALVAGALMALLLAGADMGHPARAAATPQNPTPTPATTPDYSNVDDILNGQRHLLRTDDLAVVSEPTDQTDFWILQTSDSNITKDLRVPPTTIGQIPEHDSSMTQLGRMFAFSADVVVTVFTHSDPMTRAFAAVGYSTIAQSSTYLELKDHTVVSGGFVVHAMQMADFNRDGFDDLVVNYGNPVGYNAIQIINAKNVNAFADGLIARGENVNTDNISSGGMTVGDFNGDGRPEIIGVIPQADGNGLRLVLHTVDEKTLQISDGVHFPLTIPEGAAVVPFISAAAGQFINSKYTPPHDQLLIAYAINGGTAKVKLIDFVPSPFQPIEQSSWDAGGDQLRNDRSGDYDWSGLLSLQVGRFDGSAQFDQALFLHGNNFHRVAGSSSYLFKLSTLEINPVDSSIKELGNIQLGDNYGTVYSMVLGNFDRRDPDPLNPGQKERNPDLQAAILSTGPEGYTGYVNIYDIDPTTSAPKQATTHQFAMDKAPNRMLFASGDLQGRSMRLGEPYKVVIYGAAQPSIIAAAPPMHVDYIAGQVLNLSFIPESFNTSYSVNETKTTQSSTTHATSWSFGAKETTGASFEVGSVEAGDGLKYQDTFTSAQALKGSTANTHGTYASNSFNIEVATGISDQLWYSQSHLNIYIYPVIGQTATSASGKTVPLTVQFSGPDNISYYTYPASAVEWYQPIWEYGNVLSYPGNEAQLKLLVPNIHKLSNDLTWSTDTSTLNVQTTWTVQTETGTTTKLAQNYSFDNNFSIQGAVGIPGVDSTGLSFDLDTSGSTGINDLNTSTITLGNSQGISVHKPGSFLDPPNYNYSVTSYIFGRNKPNGFVDDVIPTNPNEEKSFGLLQTAFTVDPTSSTAGGWWKQHYTIAPDVALNHPNRLSHTTPALGNSIPSNCRPTGTGSSQMDCASFSTPQPSNPWMDEFHDMRGFFISNATRPGKGSQLETARAGDILSLQARVHNYSLKAMDDGAEVHVRFYGLQWDNSNNTPVGNSFLIGEVMLPPILPFDSDQEHPNWALAGTTFDTTPYADKYLVFWVVVWAQNSEGKLISELPDHGLTTTPGDLMSLADASRIEEMHSNNVGFYKSAFYVFKASGDAPLLAAANGPDDVRLGGVNVSNYRIEVGQSVEVSALLRMGGRSVSGVTAVFYDGDPQQGGKAFDAERIPHLRAGDTHEVKVRFRPRACGQHRVFVSVGLGTPFETTSRSVPVEVVCAPPAMPACSTLCQRAPQYYLNNLNRLPNGTVLIAGGGVNSTISTGNTEQMRLALAGGNSTPGRFNRQFVAAQLSLLAAPGPGQGALLSPLSCYRLDFAPVRMRNGGAALSPSSSLGELLSQARNAARSGDVADLLSLADILGQLNGNDPTGQCSTGRAP